MSLKTVIIGCGNIAKAYAQDLTAYAEIDLVGFADLDPDRARAFADEYGGRAYASVDEVLSDERVDLVVNLTIHHAHEEVIGRALAAGKHVHTEKPLALTSEAARRLAADARTRGLRLSSAPTTWLGEPQQEALRILRSGKLETIRLAYAEINHGRIESWHPNPGPFYDIGVLWDVGIYPLTLLTAFLGPVRGVSATQRLLLPQRTAKDGSTFAVTRPEFIVATLDFASGAVARVSCNFYTKASKQGSSVEFHGDAGSLILGSSFMFNAALECGALGEPLEPVELAKPGIDGIEFARGVQELARAIAENRPHLAAAEHAIHVIEIMEAIDRSAGQSGALQNISSNFEPPPQP